MQATKLCENHCGRAISANRRNCLECSQMNPTHIIIEFKSQKSQVLYRASDGMRIAQHKEIVVIAGEDPNKGVGRAFLDFDSASHYLREVVALKDLPDGAEVRIETRDGEHTIVMPEGVMELPGGIRGLH